MKKRTSFLLLVICCLGLSSCISTNYNEIIAKNVKAALGEDVKDFTAFSYPTDNYGVGTTYILSTGATNLSYGDMFCDMWYCFGIPDADVPSDVSKWIKLNGYAGEGKGAKISLTHKEGSDIVIKALLPKIYEVLKIGGTADVKKTKTIELELGEAHIRFLRRPEWTKYINNIASGSNLYPLKQNYLQGNLTVVVSDVVVTSMKAKVSIDSKTETSMDAALGGKIPGIEKIFKDATLNFKITKEGAGVYTLETLHPVILMRLAKVQPAGEKLGAETSFDAWPFKASPDCSETRVNCLRKP